LVRVTQVAKLAGELRVGDTLVLDVLPARIIHDVSADGDLIIIQSRATQAGQGGDDTGEYAETFMRDRVVTIEVS
jgi:hypothetical protein